MRVTKLGYVGRDETVPGCGQAAMSEALAAVTALGAAVCFAAGNACQHYDVDRCRGAGDVRFGVLTRLATRPVWWLGSAVGLAGVVLQVLALAWGSLVVVQPLLVTSLLFALPAAALLRQRRVSLPDCGWAALLVASLALFLVVARPGGHNGPLRVGRLGIAVAVLGALCLVVIVLAASGHLRHRAAWWGAAAGAGLGVSSALGKYCLLLLPLSVLAVVRGWPLWVLLGTVAASVLLTQTAFQAGPLTASLPPLTMLDPVAAVCLGVVGLSESVATSPAAVAGQGLAGVAMTVAVVALARRTKGQTTMAE
jgi:drug/metabolite transporter (DMT)-like permease